MSKIDNMNIVVNFTASFYLFYDNRMKLNEKRTSHFLSSVTEDDGNGALQFSSLSNTHV
jgi:hypothetical protein